MTGEAWLLIAAGLAVGGGFCGIIVGIAWSNGYAAAMHKATVRETTPRQVETVLSWETDPIEHFPAGWPDKGWLS